MGTRGAFGFLFDGQLKVTYNHSDSYPEWLGKLVVDELAKLDSLELLKEKVRALRLVDDDVAPTPEDVRRCVDAGLYNGDVSTGSKAEWYCLLRESQPSVSGMWPALNVGLMVDSREFLAASLFCEWAYLVNLDDGVLEVYQGFQEGAVDGRFADLEPVHAKYGPVSLVATIPLPEVREGWDSWMASRRTEAA